MWQVVVRKLQAMSKHKPVKPRDRFHVRDCEPGDMMRLECGEVHVFCSRLNNGYFARRIVSGVECEFEPIDGELRMEIL